MTDDEARAILKAARVNREAFVEWDDARDCPTWQLWVGPPLATLNGQFSPAELRALLHFAPKQETA